MAVLEALIARRDFTKTDEALADYILEHADEVVRMSVAELAERSYTSSAAVNRLCRKVGSDGYRAFRVDLTMDLERRRAGAGVSADLRVSTGQSSVDTMTSVASVFRKAIDETFSTVSPMELRNATRTILRSGRVVLYGGGDSAVACEQFANDLKRIGIVSVTAYQYGSLWSATRMARKGDSAVFVSYSGALIEGLSDHARAVRDAGAKVIYVTSGKLDAATRHLCDHLLQLPAGEDIVGSAGTFFSQMTLRYALSSLYATAYSIDAETNDAHRASVVSPDWTR
ncbi:MAG: MurR/RpiR family transcriptional regulator [Olsenella sp.]|nr:MurR/RpiR family transcriptional regulator [Olsenella sp.]